MHVLFSYDQREKEAGAKSYWVKGSLGPRCYKVKCMCLFGMALETLAVSAV